MKTAAVLAGTIAALGFLTGCDTIPPGAERGPNGTMAYLVKIEATEPGARIEANGQSIGNTPVTLKIFGDPDGTFHDFGSYYYIIRGLPLQTNQYAQAIYFRTGRWFTPEDKIPQRIVFDMNRPPDGDIDQARSNRSRFMTLSHAATKSRTNLSFESSHA